MKTYKHIFFDLDHTLWDFEKNAEICLNEIYASLEDKSFNFKDFYSTFSSTNVNLWHQLELNLISHKHLREKRFLKTFAKLGVTISKEQSLKYNSILLELLPMQTHLMPGTLELLDYLKPKYDLHILTNGFKAVQDKKLSNSGLTPYFKGLFMQDVIGYKKPDKRIFNHALKHSNATAEQSLMVGDNLLADIKGATKAGIDAVFYNPLKLKAKEGITQINHLSELITLCKL